MKNINNKILNAIEINEIFNIEFIKNCILSLYKLDLNNMDEIDKIINIHAFYELIELNVYNNLHEIYK